MSFFKKTDAYANNSQAISDDELLDIVNEQDQVIQVMTRSKAYAENKLKSLRAAWLLIKNQDGKFWIPRRHASKKLMPNHLDGSACGHVSSGESYEQAMIREAQEELNIDVTHLPYKFIGKITPEQGSACFIEVFELQVSNDFVFDYNQDDFSEFYWLSAREIIEKMKAGEKMKLTLAVIIQKFYSL